MKLYFLCDENPVIKKIYENVRKSTMKVSLSSQQHRYACKAKQGELTEDRAIQRAMGEITHETLK